jgi:predicted RNA-binding protein (virulence factor B family)
VVEGELITDFVPDVIVNTSAEHMTDDWFLNTGKHTMVAMQTNNNSRFSGHINCVDSLETMQAQYPMRATIYAGEMVTPAYTRYMQIGFPA